MSGLSTTPRARTYGVVTIIVAGVLVSATGAPVPKTLGMLTGLGLPDVAARGVLHAAPVLLFAGAILGGRALARGRSRNIRWMLYGLAGAFAGFFTAFCLDLFAGAPGLLVALNGPLAEPGAIEICLWALGGMSLFVSLMVAAIAAFGTPAAQALQVEQDVDPECIEVRRAERAIYAMSSLGMFTLGVASLALAIARQAAEGATLAPSVVALTAGWISVVANYLLWRNLDELQRRQVVNGYSTSAIVATLGAFGWAVGQAAGFLPSLDAGAVFLVMTLVQLIAMTVVTSSAMGQVSTQRRLA